MNLAQAHSLEEVRTIVQQYRQEKRRKFPPALWESIVHLMQTHPIEDLAKELHFTVQYLQNKARNLAGPTFREVILQTPTDTVLIELTRFGLKARIQGSVACLHDLYKLFEK